LNPETKRGLGKEALHLHVGGLVTPTEEHIRWVDRKLKVGDEVRIRIVKEAPVDHPRSRRRPDRAADLRAQKRYVREMSRRFGWTIKTQ
jgi:DNA-directed RNA polymerase subunit E'/Rpb7